ncbi:vacuolar amino acid transporter 1-like [Ananas comosus]|uniref:Vacuolar amino acid transporter 1-like n=1 Tax=Ananas comosus TaxID=4615 RepID=A0A6P5FZ82_ANACO|nr:vacuolar amino acid transporter 1-like [Ananas comosus]
MKKDEETGPDRGFEFETDDEENQAQHDEGSDYSRSSSASASASSAHSSDYGGNEGVPSSYQPSWPQSYRQSIDMLSAVPSPRMGNILAAGSSLMQVGGSLSFLRAGSITLPPPEDAPATASLLAKPPLIVSSPSAHADADAASYAPLPPSTITPKASFLKSSYCELPPSPQCSTAQAIINGINVLCGVGILTTPYAIKEGGWLGMLLLFALGGISCYTGILLKKCLDSSPGLVTYPDIGQAAFGITGRLCISIVLYLELYACCVEYITLVSDSLTSIFPDAHVNFMGVALTPHQLFAISTAVAVLPTVWLRNLSLLSYLSAGGVVASLLVVLCLFWVGVVDGVGFRPSGTALDLSNLPVALGLYGFCYSGHSVFPNIYSSMKRRSQFPVVLIFSFLLCTILYAGVAAAGFLMFGESIKSQFTLNMPQQYLSSKLAVWTTVVNPFTKYALTMTPVALCLEELLPSTRQSYLIAVSIRTALVISTVIVALAVPFFGFVMALLGSVFTMLVALILPCLCYLTIQRRSLNLLQVCVCIVIIMVGVVCSCIGSYSSIKQMIDAKKN